MNTKYTWNDFDSDYEKLVKEIKPFLPSIRNIYAIPKSGLILGVVLSHRLGVPLILQDDIREITNETLIVDDMVESGDTLRDFIATHSYFKTAVLIWQAGSMQPNFYARKKVDNNVILFPW